MEPLTIFADVIIPLPLPGLYTYRVPFSLNGDVEIGKRVAVQFGKRKIYSALIYSLHENPPAGYEAKYLLSVIDARPVVNQLQLRLWEWISSYYMCTLGEVMYAALPSVLKFQSETRVLLNAEKEIDREGLTDNEFLVIEALEKNKYLTLHDISLIIDLRNTFPLVKALLEKAYIVIEEEVEDKYRPLKVSYVNLTEKTKDEQWMQEVFAKLERKAPRQLEMLMAFYSHIARTRENRIEKGMLLRLAGNNSSALQALVEKEVFTIETEERDRVNTGEMAEGSIVQLSAAQQSSHDQILSAFSEKNVVLLHGITSAGKTEIYINLIRETLRQDKQVLYLLPEIALTTQIITRLRRYLGSGIVIYHSKLNEQERAEIWNKVLERRIQVVIGARSALFLPYADLGFVIADEEHENSYKQFDPAPRYNARDTAVYLSKLHGAKILLGSATPSMESYFNAAGGKYGLVELLTRYGDTPAPELVIVDVSEERRKKTMKSHFSSVLLKEIAGTLEKKEQVILFQNRRGYAPVLECSICAWVPHCKNCDVSMTYHKTSDLLRCHYCGYSHRSPEKCAACGNTYMKMLGFGTEKIEEELAVFFPAARIARMDTDTTRGKNSYQNLIDQFENHNLDILVGTQMIAKGLDFTRVSLVGVVNADSLFNYPDFRASERAFQLITQVSGRAGRRDKRGKVIIQCSKPDHPVLNHIKANDYKAFFKSELRERIRYNYPPVFRLIEITVKARDFDQLNRAAADLTEAIRAQTTAIVLGPEFPQVSRIKNLYLKKIILKADKERSVNAVKEILRQIAGRFKKEYPSLIFQFDPDPQ
jgi:primosomal protein N' (replication factor Y) (superfamily II helicase)